MIPNLAKAGGSFRGAGLYYLHDKAESRDAARGDKPKTNERVWFTETRNCASDDPQQAIDEMWKTAEHQDYLKQRAGVRAGGRACTNPVQTISLSWHPSERPSQDDMTKAADEFLAHMGWHEHQALYVGHKDTDHPHIHIIMNRVHPETGLTASSSNDYRRAQAWALAFEREHGRIWCDRRQEPDNDNSRAGNTNVPHHVHDIMRETERAYRRDEERREGGFAYERDKLKADQRAEREAWFAEGKKALKQARHDAYDAVKEEFRDEWAAFHKERQAQERAAQKSFTTLMDRAFHYAKTGEWVSAAKAFEARDAKIEAVHDVFEARRADLHARQKAAWQERQQEACAELRKERDAGYKALLQRQQAARDAAKAAPARRERASGLANQVHSARKANDNKPAHALTPAPANRNPEPPTREPARMGVQIGPVTPTPATPQPTVQTPAHAPPTHDRGVSAPPKAPQSTQRPAAALSDAATTRKTTDDAVRTLAIWSLPKQAATNSPTQAPPWQKPLVRQPQRAHSQASTNLGWGASTPTKAEIDGARVAREASEQAERQPTARTPARDRAPDGTDAAAGVIGGLAGYVADQMAELFAPTPPEVREPRQKAEAKREAEKPVIEIKDQNPYARHIEAALRAVEADNERKRERDYWDDRSRTRDR